MKRLLIIISLFTLTNVFVMAQAVKFRSPAIEAYVKEHVGIGRGESLNTSQLDTIQQIDLSGLNLTEISDVKFLTNVRILDLSNNKIENIAPLASLDSLCEVNLSHNNLKSISMLSFSYAKKMYVNIAFNYVKDLSCFNTLTNCCFTIAGVDMQYDDNKSFFDVDYLVCSIQFGRPVVSCRVNSNSETKALIKFNEEETEVPVNRSSFEYELKSDVTSAAPVYLICGENVYSTYYVPYEYYRVDADNTISINVDIPVNYSLYSALAKYGEVEIDGNTINYTAPERAVPDFIDFSYKLGSTLKGISRFYVNWDESKDLIGDFNKNDKWDNEDVEYLAKTILQNQQPTKATDLNNDGKLNVADVTLLINAIQQGNWPIVNNGYEYVDLGLPSGTLWATCNVGANKPEDAGGYYAWGETDTKDDYSQSTYNYWNSRYDTGDDLGANISGTEYDVARVKWGGNWIMPSLVQIQELIDNCSHEVVTVNKVKGMSFIGSNGKSIFLPFAGLRVGTKVFSQGTLGIYRTGIPSSNLGTLTYYLLFNSDGNVYWDMYAEGRYYRYNGMTVRPVISTTDDTWTSPDQPQGGPTEEVRRPIGAEF